MRYGKGLGSKLGLMLSVSVIGGCPPAHHDDDHHDDGGGDVEYGNIETVAGTGVAGFSGDDGAAGAAQLNAPIDVLVRSTGEIVVVDNANHRIRSIDPTSNVIRTTAGGDESDAANALRFPTSVAFDSAGGFLVSAWGENRIYSYPSSGARAILAGTGDAQCAAGNSPSLASAAAINRPRSVVVSPSGTVSCSEQGCNRILQISADGQLSSYAGTGQAGYSGDGGPASEATFSSLFVPDGGGEPGSAPGFGFALSPEDPPDEMYVADTANHVIREINLLNGMIETVAGTGQPGFHDGPPDQARFRFPTAVFVGEDHSVWIVDSGNHAIRRLVPLGTRVETIVGTGTAGYNGDGISAARARLNNPGGVFVTEEGVVYVADTGNHRVRRVNVTQSAGHDNADDDHHDDD